MRRDLSILNKALGGNWLVIEGETIGLRIGADFLTGFTLPDCPDFDEWQFFQMEGLRQDLASILERLMAGHRATGDYQQAIPYARRWLALDPLHEAAHIDRVCAEITTGDIGLFESHALLMAQTKDYVRNSQKRLILSPIVERLLNTWGQAGTEDRLKQILAALREVQPRKAGYVGGNPLNLLARLKSDLSRFDFSNLTVWQAYLQGMDLQDVNFSEADLARSIFTETIHSVTSVAFSPDTPKGTGGKLLAAESFSGAIHIWDVAKGEKRLICTGHKGEVWSIAFSPDGQWIGATAIGPIGRGNEDLNRLPRPNGAPSDGWALPVNPLGQCITPDRCGRAKVIGTFG